MSNDQTPKNEDSDLWSADRLMDRWFQPLPEPSWPSLRGKVVAKVRLLRIIGRGGMGIVFEGATDELFSKRRAVKFLMPTLSDIDKFGQLQREARINGLFDHPNIVKVFGYGTTRIEGQEYPYLVMDCVRNALPLIDYAQKFRLSTATRLNLFRTICAAVAHGHSRSIVHRDLKPQNILVDSAQRPFVIDFGIARSLNQDAKTIAARDRTGVIVGTVDYMSPEQCEGKPDRIDKRADVYALGVVLYELLVGRLPYDLSKKNIAEKFGIVRREDPVPIAKYGPYLKPTIQAIVHKCLEKDPADRYPDALALLVDLIAARRGSPVDARRPGIAKTMRKIVRRNQFLSGIAVGAALMCLVALMVLVVYVPWRQIITQETQASDASEQANARKDEKTTEEIRSPLDSISVEPKSGETSPSDPTSHVQVEEFEFEEFEEETPLGRALVWLGKQQDKRHGSWCFVSRAGQNQNRQGEESEPYPDRYGATAIALLPFLRTGNTHQKEGLHKDTVEKGINFLVARAENPQFENSPEPGDEPIKGRMYASFGSHRGMYVQGFATQVLAERYSQTKAEALRKATKSAVDFIVLAQLDNGGWGYKPELKIGFSRQDSYVPSTVCQLEAISIAKEAGLDVEASVFKDATKFLDNIELPNGTYPYVSGEVRPSTTAAGLWCRVLLGGNPQDIVPRETAKEWVLRGPTEDLYFNYYATQVLHSCRDDNWSKWREKMIDKLKKTESSDGSGSSWLDGVDQGDGPKVGGRLYCTAMAALILEICHRDTSALTQVEVVDDFRE